MSTRSNGSWADMHSFPEEERWRPTPAKILAAIRKAEAGVATLQNLGKKHGLMRKFTLDGRFVGDIGELLLCPAFRITPSEKPDGHAHDLVGESDRGRIQVQVKLRRASKRQRIEFKYKPECLVVIECTEDWRQWRIVYHGPGDVICGEGIEIDAQRRLLKDGAKHILGLSMADLQKAQRQLAGDALRLEPRASCS